LERNSVEQGDGTAAGSGRRPLYFDVFAVEVFLAGTVSPLSGFFALIELEPGFG
jgi:hypothetical protein